MAMFRYRNVEEHDMRLTNIGGFRTIDEAVNYKLDLLTDSDRKFKNIFEIMFTETDNIFAEKTDGYRIIKTTYGQCRDEAIRISSILSSVLSEFEVNSIIGMYMSNSVEWIEIFWALLRSGYRPLLMNSRLDDATLNKVIEDNGVVAVISDINTEKRAFSVKTFDVQEIIGTEVKAKFEAVWSDEIILMSSGTSENVKLCVYTGEKFYHQLCNSVAIIKECKAIKRHYEGELKLLTFLPFYHIFGLAAVFMWFGFFSRTFVFLNDFGADTILNTVRKHKVTHIFAVPLLWNKVYEAALKKVKERGEKTWNKFQKGLRIAQKLDFNPALAEAFSRKAFKEVREKIFGDSIQFLIAGGSYISPEVVTFFNGIGYHMAVGFGMSEVGITSVELSDKAKVRNTCSVGKPFKSMEYMVSEEGELLIRGNGMAAKIIQSGEVKFLNTDEWFHTKDAVICSEDGRYYINGRMDDMIPCKTGENLNPNRIEAMIDVSGVRCPCLISRKNDFNEPKPVLIIEVNKYLSNDRMKEILNNVREQLVLNKLDGTINEIVLTTDALMGAEEFKINRHRISRLYEDGRITILRPDDSEISDESIPEELLWDVKEIFAEALSIEKDALNIDSHFFYDLNGSSLDYLSMLADIKHKYDVAFPENDEGTLGTIREFCKYIQDNA